ncbi:MAG: MlaD family protein [Rhodocyclaceae bacterium]
MTEPSSANLNSSGDYPSAVAVPKKRGLSLIWLVPIIAILAGGALAVRTVLEKGPEIEIAFKTAEGLEPGKTKVKFKNVDIGVVDSVTLAEDLETIKVGIRMSKSVSPLLVEDTRFWVERPRIQGTNVSGLSTLLSGAYIGMDIGKSKKHQLRFKGLDDAPLVTFSEPGRTFKLRASELGSLDAGTGIYYRRVLVGQVVRYEMDKEGRGVDFEIFVKAPYDRFINAETRFWEASGFDVELNASGFRIASQSLNALLSGGIAFETRGNPKNAAQADANASFRLFSRKVDAMAMDDDEATSLRLFFDESVRGLVVGATVDFRGVEVGRVSEIGGLIDPKSGNVKMVVDVDIYPNRLRKINVKKGFISVKDGLDVLVAGGLRGQLRTGNLLSGQLFVALEFFKKAPKAAMDWKADPPVMPSIPGSMARFEEQAAEILQSTAELMHKLKALPLDELSRDAQSAMKSLDKTLANVDRQMSDDSLLQHELRDGIREVARAAAELRTLLEYQSRYPESLLKGKSKEE